MKIRATKKLFNTSRIKEVKDPSPLIDMLPGEWYASTVSMGIPGRLAIHFLHYPTLISIIIPGKSIHKSLLEFPDHLASLLKRHGFSKMYIKYEVNTAPEIFTTNSRSILAYMNDMKFTIEYHLARQMQIERIEDIEFENLFGGKLGEGDYITPKEILSRLLIN
jgi:hypothetical protein